jgi:hypothetical protein
VGEYAKRQAADKNSAGRKQVEGLNRNFQQSKFSHDPNFKRVNILPKGPNVRGHIILGMNHTEGKSSKTPIVTIIGLSAQSWKITKN